MFWSDPSHYSLPLLTRASLGLRFADLNPDRMRPVYRRYHLLIVGQRDDERSGALTAAVVDVLSGVVPGGVVPAHAGLHAFFAGQGIPND